MLAAVGIACSEVDKARGAEEVIEQGRVDLVINVPRAYDEHGLPDGYRIRRQAIDCGVPLVTDLAFARALVATLRARSRASVDVIAWNDFNHGTRESRTAAAH
jgi:carbamoyl-phosphate synthase large subunit